MFDSFIKHLKRYLKDKKIRKEIEEYHADCVFNDINTYNRYTQYGGSNVFGTDVVFSGSIGYGSYIGEKTKLPCSSVGKYCSISWNVTAVVGRHPTNTFVSTHPAFFSIAKQAGFAYIDETIFQEYEYSDDNGQYIIRVC